MEEVWFQSDMIQMDALFNAYTLLLDIRLRIIYAFFWYDANFDTLVLKPIPERYQMFEN